MKKLIRTVFGLLTLVAVVFIAGALFYGTKTVHDLLGENKKLKQAITTLTHEDQIGYAKVVLQETRSGKLYTTVRFVEPARDDRLKLSSQRNMRSKATPSILMHWSSPFPIRRSSTARSARFISGGAFTAKIRRPPADSPLKNKARHRPAMLTCSDACAFPNGKSSGRLSGI